MHSMRKHAEALARPVVRRGVARELLANVASYALWPLGLSDTLFEKAVAFSHVEVPARDMTPVVLVHGYGGSKSSFVPLIRRLQAAGMGNVHTLEYVPLRKEGVAHVGERLARLVEELTEESGAKVHLVGHSAGGIVIREAVLRHRIGHLVTSVTTLASPHQGSPLGRLGKLIGDSLGAFAQQLGTGSAYLTGLNEERVPAGIRWMAMYSSLDAIVPGNAGKLHERYGARNVHVKNHGHLSLVLSAEVMQNVVEHLLAGQAQANIPQQRSSTEDAAKQLSK